MVRFFENAEDDLEAARIAKEFGNADELGKANKAEKFEGVIDDSKRGEDRYKVDNCHGGKRIMKEGTATMVSEAIISSNPAKNVIHNEDSDANFVDGKKEADIIFEEEGDNAKDDDHNHSTVVKAAEAIGAFVGLDDGKNTATKAGVNGLFVWGGGFGSFVRLGGFIGLFGLFGGDAFDFDL